MITNLEKQKIIVERLQDFDNYIQAIELDPSILDNASAVSKADRTRPLTLEDIRSRREALQDALLDITNTIDNQL